jgi:hypothetical protein
MLPKRASAGLLVLVLLSASADGADTEADNPTSHPTIGAALEEMGAKYGSGATALQGYLLNHAIQGGSVLDITVSIAGIELRRERRYLVYKVDTGIVYRTDEVSPARQLARIWSDVVEPSARKAAQMNLPSDGIALLVTYRRGSYSDRADLQRQLQARHITAAEAGFYVLNRDAIDLLAAQITSQELAARAEVQVDGQPARVDLSLLADQPRE